MAFFSPKNTSEQEIFEAMRNDWLLKQLNSQTLQKLQLLIEQYNIEIDDGI